MATLPPISISDLDQLRQTTPSHKTSEILCRMAIFSYFETERKIRMALGENFSNLLAWTDDDVNNQGFLAWDSGIVVLVFRGTDSVNDWKKNSEALFPDHHPLGGRRHDGFHDVWKQMPQPTLAALNDEVDPNSQLWISGHSLGGAVATAASAAFLIDRPERVAENFGVMTIGAPRFGNKQFVQAYDEKMRARHWFYVNQGDPVPNLPPKILASYRHSGTLKYFDKSGEHLPLTKEQAGLQSSGRTPESRAANHWFELDEEFSRVASTRENLEVLMDEIGQNARTPELHFVDDGVEIRLMKGAMQGDSRWTTSAHDSGLYWQRIRVLSQATAEV